MEKIDQEKRELEARSEGSPKTAQGGPAGNLASGFSEGAEAATGVAP